MEELDDNEHTSLEAGPVDTALSMDVVVDMALEDKMLKDGRVLGKILVDMRGFGLLSIIRFHSGPNFDPIRIAAGVLMIAQWILPVGLVIHTLKTDDNMICPRTGSLEAKIYMCTISAIYFVKTFISLKGKTTEWNNAYKYVTNNILIGSSTNKYEEISDQESGINVKKKKRKKGFLPERNSLAQIVEANALPWKAWNLPYIRDLVIFDIVYDAGVYIFSLWLVFETVDPMDMVVKTLTFEFLTKLDDEFKKLYFKYDGSCAVNMLLMGKDEDEREKLPSEVPPEYKSISSTELWIHKIVASVVLPASPMVALLFTFVGPYCK
ncbi:unnamed protein product [Discosporangium mesarthrocarpum]